MKEFKFDLQIVRDPNKKDIFHVRYTFVTYERTLHIGGTYKEAEEKRAEIEEELSDKLDRLQRREKDLYLSSYEKSEFDPEDTWDQLIQPRM